jgi:hypothetical protein
VVQNSHGAALVEQAYLKSDEYLFLAKIRKR